VYFVDGNQQLAPVTREVMIPASPDKARVQLQAGVVPTDPAGLRSSIPPGTLLGVTVSGGKATVNLAPIAQETVAQEQVLLFGQIVMTLTEQRGVGQVEFLLPSVDGAPQTPILVPTATSAPKTLVSADDYRSLVAPEVS
jgi:spore germination protein GerM